MKKSKIIALVLVVSIMLMGAGYAAWYDQLAIHNTVSTGDLTVQFVKDADYPHIGSNYYTYDPNYAFENGQRGTFVCSSDTNTYVKTNIKATDKKTETVTIGNMYPGAMASYEAKIKNTGSIPAVISDVQVTFNAQPANSTIDPAKWNSDVFKSNCQAYGGITYYAKQADGTYQIDGNKNKWFYANLNNYGQVINDNLKGLRMEPGDYITFDIPNEYKAEVAKLLPGFDTNQNCLIFFMEPTAGEDTEKQGASFDITFNFRQFNMPDSPRF